MDSQSFFVSDAFFELELELSDEEKAVEAVSATPQHQPINCILIHHFSLHLSIPKSIATNTTLSLYSNPRD